MLTEKLSGLQCFRAMAVLMVVLMHAHAAVFKDFPNYTTSYYLSVGHGGVDYFFILSGYIIARICTSKKRRQDHPFKFLLRRWARILPLYWIVTFALIVVLIISPSLIVDNKAPSILKSLFLIPDRQLFLLPVGWTLTFELLFYGLVFVSLFIQSNYRHHFVVVILIALVALGIVQNITLKDQIRPILDTLTSPIWLEFLIGYLVAVFVMPAKLSKYWPIYMTLGIAWLAVAFGFRFAPELSSAIGVERLLIHLVPGSLFLLAFIGVEEKINQSQRIFRLPVHIGDLSYSVYLWHVPVISVIVLISHRLFPDLPNGILLPVTILVATAQAHISFRFIEYPVLKICNRWINSVFMLKR